MKRRKDGGCGKEGKKRKGWLDRKGCEEEEGWRLWKGREEKERMAR